MNSARPQDASGSISGFLDEARAVCRLRHLSLRTEERYVEVIRNFILFHGKKHPARLGAAEVRSYLT